MGKNMTFWPLGMYKNFFWPAMRFELCTPGLNHNNRVSFEVMHWPAQDILFIGLLPEKSTVIQGVARTSCIRKNVREKKRGELF